MKKPLIFTLAITGLLAVFLLVRYFRNAATIEQVLEVKGSYWQPGLSYKKS